MLYIFHVDTGRMMTFEMDLALKSVQVLKETIERQYGLPMASLVLLVSGGEMLEADRRVCNYSAGTDTNPIYMFSTTIIESKNPPQPWPSIEPDTDLHDQVERSLALPPSYNTVVTRSQLAQQFHDLAKEETKICEKLVLEQHLQQQGWAAVIANMEDITAEFRERCDDFYQGFADHLKRRSEYLDFLLHFNDDLDKLAKIPILPPLVQNAEEKPFQAFDELYADTESFSKTTETTANGQTVSTDPVTVRPNTGSREPTPESSTTSKEMHDVSDKKKQTQAKPQTLLQWISASENQKSLRRISEDCSRGLQLFDDVVIDGLKSEVAKAIEAAQQENIKEIKGLEDRLSGLDKLMYDAKKIVQDQNELSQAFLQNQTRASNLGDPSIFPDLCASHRSQLLLMLKKHRTLRDIRRRISKAKEELGINLYQRLKFIIYIENRMCEIDSKLLFYHRCLKRLQRHLGIIEQIHRTPCMYVTAVTEVVRRKLFSNAFLVWASDLACQLLSIYNDEVMRRREFGSLFEGHFLGALFPGMDDMPPAYATQAPSMFDASLPNLTRNDIEMLSNQMADISAKIEMPDIGAVIEFFSPRNASQKSHDKSSLSDCRAVSVQCGGDSILPKPIDLHTHLRDYEKGFESETDTEEFEKVGQSPMVTAVIGTGVSTQTLDYVHPETCTVSTATDTIMTQSTETITEDNLGTTRIEVERLKGILKEMYQLSNNSIAFLREQLDNMKTQSADDKTVLKTQFDTLTNTWRRVQDETQLHEREVIQRLTIDHELEMNDVRNSLIVKNEEIETLRSDRVELQATHDGLVSRQTKANDDMHRSVNDLMETVRCLEEQLNRVTSDREQAIDIAKQKLIKDHKTEIESLRCKYKLMVTSMERSPSDTSLEKIERPDMIDVVHHEPPLSRKKDAALVDSAMRRAVERERARLEFQLQPIPPGSSPRSPTTSQDFFKRILEEKDRQLDALRDRENVLLKKVQNFQETIQSLTDQETNDPEINSLKDRIVIMQKDRRRLENELTTERSRRQTMENSVSSIRNADWMGMSVTGSPGAGPEVLLKRSNLTSTETARLKKWISLEACQDGDTVLVLWDAVHRQYLILQDDPIFYFLHAESYAILNLAPPPSDGSTPNTTFIVGKVLEKEYCVTKKDENRYRVSKGTKFYRVKVIPRVNVRPDSKSCSHSKSEWHPAIQSVSEYTPRLSNADTFITPLNLIDSFAQTEFVDDSSKDMTDSGVVAQQKSIYKERNISVTEEDEPVSLTDDRCRYISVSEEEEQAAAGNLEDRSMKIAVAPSAESYYDQDDSDDFRSLETKDDVEISPC